MEHKTLYRNEEAVLTALAVLPVERAVTSSSTVLQSAFSDDFLRLQSGEELRLFLFAGTQDGTILSFRCCLRVSGSAKRSENLISMEAGKRCRLRPPGEVASPEETQAAPTASPAVTFLATSRELPLLFALAGGRLECLRCTDLQPLGPAYFRRIQLPDGAVVAQCCTAKDQDMSQSRVVSAKPTVGGASAASPTDNDAPSAIEDEVLGAVSGSHPFQRFALVIGQHIYLIECSARGAFHMQRPPTSATESHTPLAAILAVPLDAGSVMALDWQADTLLVATPTSYIAYDTVSCLPLHHMRVAAPNRPAPAGAVAPSVRYLSRGSVLPDDEEEDDGRAADWAFATELAALAKSDGANGEGTSTDEDDTLLSEWEGGPGHSWPASLLYSTPDHALHMLNAVEGATVSASRLYTGSGAALDAASSWADLQRTPTLATCVHPVSGAVAVSPFLMVYRASKDKGGGQFVLQSCFDAEVWASPTAVGADDEEDTAASAAVGSPDAVVRLDASVGVLTRLVVTPVGVLCLTAHSIEAVLLLPAAQQIRALVEAGQYASAVRFTLAGTADLITGMRHDTDKITSVAGKDDPAAPPGSALARAPVTAANGDDPEDGGDGGSSTFPSEARNVDELTRAADRLVDERLRDLYRACATHALACGRYEEAFRCFARADIPVLTLLRLFPEFQCPSDTDTDAAVAAPLTLTYPHSEAPYRILFEMLSFFFYQVVLPARDADRERAAGEGMPAPPTAQEVAAVEFALFLLLVLDHGALADADAIAAFFAEAKRLPLRRCLSYIATRPAGRQTPVEEAAAHAPPYPRQDLVPLLLASAGKTTEALAACRRVKDVVGAATVLSMAPASERGALCEGHLPWMLRADPETAMAAMLHTAHGTARAAAASEDDRVTPEVVVPILVGRGGGEALHAYLTFQIYSRASRDRRLHTLYATNMIDMAQLLSAATSLRAKRAEGEPLRATPHPLPRPPAGGEAGLLGAVRRALLQYLADATIARYEDEPVLARLRKAELQEEQVVVLHRMGDHAGALRVLAYGLNDVEGAVAYCFHQQERETQAASLGGCGHAVNASAASLLAPVPSASTGMATGAGAVASPTTDRADSPVAPTSPRRRKAAGTASEVLSGSNTGIARVLPSRECLTAVEHDLKLLHRFTNSTQSTWHTDTVARSSGTGGTRRGELGERFNHHLHTLLQVLWVAPTGAAPKTDAALHILNRYAHFLDPVAVLASLPGDVPLPWLASYLTRSFQTAELDATLSEVEAAAARSVVSEATGHCTRLQQRCVMVDAQRLCAGCRQPVREKELLAVFPNLKITHFRCQQDGHLDPERGAPYRNILQ